MLGLQAARLLGLHNSLISHFQRHQMPVTKPLTTVASETLEPQPPASKWRFTSVLRRAQSTYQMVWQQQREHGMNAQTWSCLHALQLTHCLQTPCYHQMHNVQPIKHPCCTHLDVILLAALQVVQEPTPSASTGTPAYMQALYLQKRSQEAASRQPSIELVASRQESSELAASTLGRQTSQLAQQLSAPWLTDEQVQQQQIKCTVIKALLQLIPLVAEEAKDRQINTEPFVHELMSESGLLLHAANDPEGSQAELRQLCILMLAATAAQPQSIATLLGLQASVDDAAPVLSQSLHVHGHVLLHRISEHMQANLQTQQVMRFSVDTNVCAAVTLTVMLVCIIIVALRVVLSTMTMQDALKQGEASSDLTSLCLQGVIGFQHCECYMQLVAEYLTTVHDPNLPSIWGFEASRTWMAVPRVSLTVGPIAFYTQRRTMFMASLMQVRTAWMHSQCQVR